MSHDQSKQTRGPQGQTQTSNKHRVSRRQFMLGGGAGLSLLLRGLATGLPPAWLSAPHFARAQEMNATLPQTLILSTSSAGDPVNVNCPGAYVQGLENNPILPISEFSLGGDSTVRAASVWGDLPATLRDQLAFFHYSSRTAAHPEYSVAMSLHGAVKNEQGNGSEMLTSALASLGEGPLSTLQREPLPLCKEFITFEGQPLQNMKPSELKALFAPQEDNLADLRSTRDLALDELYGQLKVEGTRVQRKFLDRYLQSRDQSRTLGEELGTLLERLSDDPDLIDGPQDQVIAAVALTKLRIAPVITIKIPFGGDNHQDADLSIEAAETTSGVNHIQNLWTELGDFNLRDSTTFGLLNVFGRQFQRNGQGGRNHNRYHGVMVAFGSGIRGGVYGGVNAEGQAMNIDPNSGLALESGGISADSALESAGASLARAMGYSEEVVSQRVQGGQVVRDFVRS
jgi:hypothetical protein